MDQQQPSNQAPNQAPAAAPAPSGTSTTAPGAAKHSGLFMFGTYVFFFLPYFSEAKNDPFVKFHMKQSLGLLICRFAVSIIFDNILHLWSLASLLQLVVTIFWIIAIVKAVQGKQEKVAFAGEYFEKYLKI